MNAKRGIPGRKDEFVAADHAAKQHVLFKTQGLQGDVHPGEIGLNGKLDGFRFVVDAVKGVDALFVIRLLRAHEADQLVGDNFTRGDDAVQAELQDHLGKRGRGDLGYQIYISDSAAIPPTEQRSQVYDDFKWTQIKGLGTYIITQPLKVVSDQTTYWTNYEQGNN